MDLLPFFFVCENHRFSHKFKQISNNSGVWIKIQGPGTTSFGRVNFRTIHPWGVHVLDAWIISNSSFFLHQVGPCWTMLDSLKHRNFHGPEKWRNWSPPENCRKLMEFPWSVPPGCRALMRLQLMDGDPSSVLGQVLALRETSKDIGLAYRCQLEVNTAWNLLKSPFFNCVWLVMICTMMCTNLKNLPIATKAKVATYVHLHPSSTKAAACALMRPHVFNTNHSTHHCILYILYYIVLYYIILYCSVLYYIILYCIILYYNYIIL